MHPPIVFFVILALGCLVSFIGAVWVLVAAFRQSIAWGLIALFVPMGNLVYAVLHWAEAKKGFLLSLVGGMFCLGSFFTIPEVRAGVAGGTLPALFPKAGPPAPDVPALIAEKRAQLEGWNAAFAQDGVELGRQYVELEARRKAWKAGDAQALEKFNADAAIYQARTARRKQRYAEIEAGQRELDALLATRPPAAEKGGGAGGRAVVIYTTSHCPACQMAKQYFAQKGVSFQEIDVETSREGREAFQRLGGRGVPLILVGEKRLEGFSAPALDALL